jgi:formamidopyrimidine-DNA glycosylase
MPELPEVEAARLELARHVTGRRVQAVHTYDDEVVLRPSPLAVVEALQGRLITGTGRHGKLQWMELAATPSTLPHPPGVLSIHFGMGGALRYSTSPAAQRAAAWPPAHTKLEIALEGGLSVAVTDSDARRLLRVRPYESAAAATAHLGLDAHTQYPDVGVLAALLASSRPIKALLMDQSLLAGVGNYLADEALYQAGIHPATAAAAVAASPASVQALHAALGSVLQHCVSVQAQHSRYPVDWLFHRRWNKGRGYGGGSTLEGHRIEWSLVGGRITAAVQARQGLPLAAPPGARVRGSKAAAAAAVKAARAVAGLLA